MEHERRPTEDDCTITIRRGTANDAAAVEWVAQRDTRRVPHGPLLLAEVNGRLLAARSLADGQSVADPFMPTADLTRMLERRASQLEGPSGGRRGLGWRGRRSYAHA